MEKKRRQCQMVDLFPIVITENYLVAEWSEASTRSFHMLGCKILIDQLPNKLLTVDGVC